MKVLYVSTAPLEYSASSNVRNIAVLKGLIENGCEIYTLTPYPKTDSPSYDKSLNNIEIKHKYFIDMGVLHVYAANKNSKFKKIVYNVIKKFKIYDFRSNLAKKQIIIDEKFDLIISSSDPKSSHLVAEKLIINNKNIADKWLQYWGDPFSSDINDKRRLIKYFIKKEEMRILKKADIILYVSPFTLEVQKKKFSMLANKMHFLPIPYNSEIVYNKKSNSKKIMIGYFGDYYQRNRNIIPLYNMVKENSNMELIICGDSEKKLDATKNINVYPRLSMSKVKQFEAEVDILVCVCNLYGTQIPGKIYHYAATNKPIIIILDGDRKNEMKKYFESFDRYELCENNSSSILNSINKIINSKDDYIPSKELSSYKIANDILKIVKYSKK